MKWLTLIVIAALPLVACAHITKDNKFECPRCHAANYNSEVVIDFCSNSIQYYGELVAEERTCFFTCGRKHHWARVTDVRYLAGPHPELIDY